MQHNGEIFATDNIIVEINTNKDEESMVLESDALMDVVASTSPAHSAETRRI